MVSGVFEPAPAEEAMKYMAKDGENLPQQMLNVITRPFKASLSRDNVHSNPDTLMLGSDS